MGYTVVEVQKRVIRLWILTGLFWAGLLSAQDPSGEQGLRRAIEAQQSGHFTEAIAGYRKYLETHPAAAGVRSNLGAALAHEGRYTDAIQQYGLALNAQPSNYGIRFNLGLADYKEGEVVSAVREFETVYATIPAESPERRRVALLLSECFLRQGEDERVISLLDPISDTDPNDLALDYLLGTALLHQGQDELGALMIERILKNGDTAEAHMLMAFTRMKANDKKGAAFEVDRALALKPNLPEAYILQGRLAFLESDLKGSEAAFRKALDVDPNTFDAQFWLGTLLRQEGRLKESRVHLQRALQLSPKDILVSYQVALLCSDEGNDRQAATLLESLVKEAPEYTEAHRSLSSIYFRLGRAEEGRKERKIAEQMDAAIQAKDYAKGRTLK